MATEKTPHEIEAECPSSQTHVLSCEIHGVLGTGLPAPTAVSVWDGEQWITLCAACLAHAISGLVPALMIRKL